MKTTRDTDNKIIRNASQKKKRGDNKKLQISFTFK